MNRSVPESLLICILVLCLALTPISVREKRKIVEKHSS